MRRITITLDDELADDFDRYLQDNGYQNRSEGMRDLVRQRLQSVALERDADGDCIGVLSYVFNHHERELARRLTHAHHGQHDLGVATLHVHLDHHNCLENVVLRGRVAAVRSFAETVIAQTGVRHGQLQLIPARIERSAHRHGDSADDHAHTQPLN